MSKNQGPKNRRKKKNNKKTAIHTTRTTHAQTSKSMSEKASGPTRWHKYYADEFLPWDSGKPSSQLVSFVHEAFGDRLPQASSDTVAACEPGKGDEVGAARRPRAVEIGCGTGGSCVFLAQQGFHVVGVDLVPEAVEAARSRAEAAGVAERCTFLVGDALQLPRRWREQQKQEQQKQEEEEEEAWRAAQLAPNTFDLVYDCQTFHVLRKLDEEGIVGVYRQLLKPGGFLLTLTGNAKEPEVGPCVLSREELQHAFREMRVVSVAETRFDMTPTYAKLAQPPLAWCGVFQEP